MSHQAENKRGFERYSIALNVEVKSLDDQTVAHCETTVLKDISGGGARFVTHNPDYYSIGQKVDLLVRLPAEGVLNTGMNGAGRVVWIGELDEDEISVGLCMDDLLAFQHIVDGNS